MIKEILTDKTIKPKARTESVSELLLSKKLSVEDLLDSLDGVKPPVKASCIEAIEFATQKEPSLVSKDNLKSIISFLSDKEPRIKWESAKVIANTISFHPGLVENAVSGLLVNTEHTGTVVRWSAATALAVILKLDTKINTELVPTVKTIIEQEEKNSIKKIYLSALKKLKL